MTLSQVFGADHLFFPQLPEHLLPHLHPLPPFSLQYTIRVDPEFHASQSQDSPNYTIYDLVTPVDDPLKGLMSTFLNHGLSPVTLRNLATLDLVLADVVQAINHSKAKRAFFAALEADPVGFLKRWEKSQRRDLAVILGENVVGIHGPVETRTGSDSSVWESDGIRESVALWLGTEGSRR
jgi:SWI/SNF-related matrix-associated actin-dependent regulator of chromatin subfamily D